jgi:hypothetical protein
LRTIKKATKVSRQRGAAGSVTYSRWTE